MFGGQLFYDMQVVWPWDSEDEIVMKRFMM